MISVGMASKNSATKQFLIKYQLFDFECILYTLWLVQNEESFLAVKTLILLFLSLVSEEYISILAVRNEQCCIKLILY
jgi:hypothetical protein